MPRFPIALRPSSLLRSISSSSSSSSSPIPTPSSSSSPAPISYTSPIPAKANAAYDTALSFLALDREHKLKELERARSEGVDAERLEELEVKAAVNDPEIRWRSENDAGRDMSLPIYRHLAERKWRQDGELAILMQRVTQMSLVPDLLPTISPIADLRMKVKGETLVPGVFVLPSLTIKGVKLEARVWHKEEKLYTLVMIDPDVPDEASHSYTTFLHWLVPNITLSSTRSQISTPALLPYLPPHPHKGTPYHRYSFFLLAQSTPLELVAESIDRTNFSLRDFVGENKLEAEGVTFFRAKWDKSVGGIVRDAFGGMEELEFGPVPKAKREGSDGKYRIE